MISKLNKIGIQPDAKCFENLRCHNKSTESALYFLTIGVFPECRVIKKYIGDVTVNCNSDLYKVLKNNIYIFFVLVLATWILCYIKVNIS